MNSIDGDLASVEVSSKLSKISKIKVVNFANFHFQKISNPNFEVKKSVDGKFFDLKVVAFEPSIILYAHLLRSFSNFWNNWVQSLTPIISPWRFSRIFIKSTARDINMQPS